MKNRTHRSIDNIEPTLEVEATEDTFKTTVEPVNDVIEPSVKVEKSKKAKVVNCISLNLRKEPSGEILKLIPVESVVNIKSVNGDWTQIEFEGETGYVMTEFIENM